MKQLLKNISPFNNRTEMSTILFIMKKIVAFFLCYIVGLLVAEQIIILLHFPFGKNMLVGDAFDSRTITLISYYGYIVISGIVVIYWKLIEKKPLSEMGLTRHFGNYFAGAITGILLLAISVIFIILTGNIKYYGIFENSDILVIILFIAAFMIQGATEEFLCRGLILHTLKEKTSLGIAIAVSTIMFIIPHWSSLFAGETIYGAIGIANLVLISIILSMLTIHFKSIWVACGLHSFWNAVLYSVLGLNLSGNTKTVTAIFNMQSTGNNIWNGGEYGIEASMITTGVLAITAIAINITCDPQ